MTIGGIVRPKINDRLKEISIVDKDRVLKMDKFRSQVNIVINE